MSNESTHTDVGAPETKSGGASTWIKLIIVIAIVALGIVFRENIQGALKATLTWIGDLGPWGPIAFIAIYIVCTILFIPGSVLTLGSGILFGVAYGSIYVSIASTIGATFSFLIGRYLARDAIQRKVEGNAKFAAIDAAVADEGWKIVGLTRLSPIFPFNLLNYAFGLTRVKLGHYLPASWIGMMPGTVMYVYIGSLVGDLSAIGSERSKSTGEWVITVVGFIATVVVTVYVTKIARKALDKKVTE